MGKYLKNEFTLSETFLNQIIKTQNCLTSAEFDLQALMQLIAEQMQALTQATGAVIELIENNQMVYRAATGTVEKFIGLRLNIENSISGLCVHENTILFSEDTEIDPRVNQEACRLVEARSLVVAPLIYQNKTVGVLKIVSKKPHTFNTSHVKTLQLMANFIAAGLAHQIAFETNKKLLAERNVMLIELQAANNKLYHMAYYDHLTHLPNRKTFTENIKHHYKHWFDFL